MVAFNPPSAQFTAALAAGRTPGPTSNQLEAAHDAVLVGRFRAGEAEAFTEIVTRHRRRVFALALARLGNHADAEDITQDTFIRAHRALAAFRGESSLATWLHRIAVNLSLNQYWYFFRRRRHLTQSLDCALGGESTATLADVVASDEPNPASETMTAEFAAAVALCMTRLSPAQHEILRLRTVLDRSYAEIAIALRLNVGTVKSRIARARRSLYALVVELCPELAPTAVMPQ